MITGKILDLLNKQKGVKTNNMAKYRLTKKEKKLRHYISSSRKRAKRRKNQKLKLKTERRLLEGKSTLEIKEIERNKKWIYVDAPVNFSFLSNAEEVIALINKIKIALIDRKSVFVNMNSVENLDNGAIVALLSILIKFNSRGIKFNGSNPINNTCQKKLKESGFFEILFKGQDFNEHYSFEQENQIFKGTRHYDADITEEIMKKASRTIWGEKRACKALHRIIVELQHNTINHAGNTRENEEYWWLLVNYNKAESTVSFAFVDYGLGIFDSLNGKRKGQWVGYLKKIENILKFGTNDEIMNIILDGRFHLSVTKKPFRGKGLPGIRQEMSRNRIDKLHLISNDVYSDVEKNEHRLLKNKFKGTFLYWELNKNNENKIWTIQ